MHYVEVVYAGPGLVNTITCNPAAKKRERKYVVRIHCNAKTMEPEHEGLTKAFKFKREAWAYAQLKKGKQ